MKTLAELIVAFRAGRITLAELLAALDERGAIGPANHLSELAGVKRLGDSGGLDPATAESISGRLRRIQSGDGDSTEPVTRPAAADVTTPTPPADDAAAEIAAPPPTVPADDVTRFRSSATRPPPGARGPDPLATQAATRSGTVSGTSSSSSWQRVAESAGGDSVSVGSLLKGRFLLEREIGRGGMGVVYLARDERKVEARDRDPYVAIKVLNDEFRRHPDSLIALQRESRRSQRLAHDNIVRVFDFDKDGTIVFMTMEYVDGSDLKGLIRDRADHGLSLKEAWPLIEGMCRGLARAHAEGIVHSDFKPGNVMVTRDGVAKVFDFGIARAGKIGDAVGDTTVFDAGSLGALTPAYASLEMIQGKAPQGSDDLYALGCVVFELLTGKHPFDKIGAEVAQREGRRPPPVPGLSKRQYKALCSAVAFTREQRMQDAMDLVEGLRERSLVERAMPYLKIGVPALLVLGGGVLGLLSWRETQRIDALFARFEVSSAGAYASEDEAQSALEDLDEDTRNRLVLARSSLIERFLLARIDSYWRPDQNRFDYPGAEKVFALRDRLKLYSPALDVRRADVERSRNDLLNSLDSTLAAQIDADQIDDRGPENVVQTLRRVQAIDPSSALLKSARLELKYDAAIGDAIDKGRLDEARQRLELARRWFADSARIKARATQIGELAASIAAEQQKAQDAARLQQARDQTLAALTALVERPADSADWRRLAADAYRKAAEAAAGDKPHGQRVDAQATRLRTVLARQVRETPDLPAAIDLAGFGLDLFPGDPALAKARQSLLDLQNQRAQDAQTRAQREEQSKARIASLLAKPLGTAVWLQDIRSALAEADGTLGSSSPAFTSLRSQVDAGIQKLARERLAAGALDDAERLAKAGQQIDSSDTGHAAVLVEVGRAREDARSKVAAVEAERLGAARRTLADLLARPQLTADWQRSVSFAIDALKGDGTADAQALVDSLGERLATELAKVTTPQGIPQARQALDFGLKRQPKSARLLEQRARIDQLQRDSQARIDQENAEAEVKARIESAKSAAAANDIQKARESLSRVKALQPDHPFVKVEGPQLLADAYLRLAAEAFQRRNWQTAADLIAQAQKTVGDRPGFQGLKARYDLVAAIKKAGDPPLSGAAHEALRKQLADASRLDASALSRMESELAAAGQLKEKTFAAQIDALRPSLAKAATPAPTPDTRPAPAAGPAPAPAAAPVPKPGADARPAAPATPTAPTIIEGDEPYVATGPDPCNKPALIGTGKPCFDALSGARRGPRLAIVPGIGTAPGYGLTRAEVSIANFNEFCIATASCSPKPISDEDYGSSPISGISAGQAQAYAAWLTRASGGYLYRLPTEAEWLHAARGGGSFRQAGDSNCVAAGSQPGGGAPVSPKGREANAWGLVHMSGNVWEWVTAGSRLTVRGAGFNEPWPDCTVDARRDDDGGPKKDVGFRVLRELK